MGCWDLQVEEEVLSAEPAALDNPRVEREALSLESSSRPVSLTLLLRLQASSLLRVRQAEALECLALLPLER